MGKNFWQDFSGRIFLGGYFWEDFLEEFFVYIVGHFVGATFCFVGAFCRPTSFFLSPRSVFFVVGPLWAKPAVRGRGRKQAGEEGQEGRACAALEQQEEEQGQGRSSEGGSPEERRGGTGREGRGMALFMTHAHSESRHLWPRRDQGTLGLHSVISIPASTAYAGGAVGTVLMKSAAHLSQ